MNQASTSSQLAALCDARCLHRCNDAPATVPHGRPMDPIPDPRYARCFTGKPCTTHALIPDDESQGDLHGNLVDLDVFKTILWPGVSPLPCLLSFPSHSGVFPISLCPLSHPHPTNSLLASAYLCLLRRPSAVSRLLRPSPTIAINPKPNLTRSE